MRQKNSSVHVMGILSAYLKFVLVFAITYAIVYSYCLVNEIQDENKEICSRCDNCDALLHDGNEVFCAPCFDKDDTITTAVKERETSLRYTDIALRQRGILNKPTRRELKKIHKQKEDTRTLIKT